MNWFRRTTKSIAVKPISCWDVVSQYVEVLAIQQSGVGLSMNEDDLPYDKPLIKAAIIEVSKNPNLPEESVAALAASFVSLANFQQGGGGKSLYDELPTVGDREALYNFAKKMDEQGELESELLTRVRIEAENLLNEWEGRISGGNSGRNMSSHREARNA